MVLVIDTSSARVGLALVGEGGEVLAERVLDASRELDLAGEVEALLQPRRLTGVAVALGPGSFTGLRVGVAYGVGLALGLRVPLLGLETLAICRRRSRQPARGLSEAGRGRVYQAAEGDEPVLCAAAELPSDLPLVGWLRPGTRAALAEAGLALLPESELTGFGVAAAALLGLAPELGYGRVRLRYMQSYGARA